MTLFTIPTFTRRPSFTLYFNPSSPASAETLCEKPLDRGDVPQPLRKRKVSSISSPKGLVPSNPSKPFVRAQRHQHPLQPKRSPRPVAQRVTRSQSRAHLLVPRKSTPTQILTLTSATSISTQAKDIEDVDINTISFPSPPSPRSLRYSRSFLSQRSNSTIPSRSGMMVGGTRCPPPRPGMGRGRGIVTAAHSPPRTGNNPRSRTSPSPPPSAGAPHKRARLTSSSRAVNRADAATEADDNLDIPARPGSPTPGSGPAPVTPPVSPQDNPNNEKVWEAMSCTDTTSLLPPGDDDDDDIIVFKMDVEDTLPVPLSRPPSPVQQMMEVEETSAVEIISPVVPPCSPCSSPPLEDSVMLDDPREDMQRQSILLAKRVRKRMNPSLPDGKLVLVLLITSVLFSQLFP
ncbi:hypothetical protein DL96DRAFT_172491 [Flagelloscypha sp. PMI_526]|nr:hypothetical protein DL96DRAFT_172491 [Flagelloscypha sp. PMI_526]